MVGSLPSINKGIKHVHHDALEFPDGEVMLTCLGCNQHATVLQLPAAPKTVEEAKEQERVAWAGMISAAHYRSGRYAAVVAVPPLVPAITAAPMV